MLMEGNANDEFQELNELHIIVLSCIHWLIDHGHLSKIELYLNHAGREKAAHGLEQLLSGINSEANVFDVVQWVAEDIHNTL